MPVGHANVIAPGSPGAMPPYYRPSDNIPPRAFVAAASGGLVALCAAFLYAWVTMPAPGPANVLALLVFGVSIGLVVDQVARLGHVRNRGWITRYAIVLSACAWYGQWVAWRAFAAQGRQGGFLLQHVVSLAVDPGALFAGAVAQSHARGVGTLSMTVIWLLEALILLACAPWWGRSRTAQPYCEASAAWAESVRVPWDFACVDDPVAAARLLERAPARLFSLLTPFAERDAPDGASYTQVTLYRCRGNDTFVSIANVMFTSGTPEMSVYHEEEWLTLLRLPDTNADGLMAQLLAPAHSQLRQTNKQ